VLPLLLNVYRIQRTYYLSYIARVVDFSESEINVYYYYYFFFLYSRRQHGMEYTEEKNEDDDGDDDDDDEHIKNVRSCDTIKICVCRFRHVRKM